MSVLDNLLAMSSLPQEKFFNDYFRKTPFAAPDCAQSLCHEEWSLILADILRSHNDCWLVDHGKLMKDTGHLSSDEAMQGFRCGQTILVRHSEKAHPFFMNLADDFFRVFHKPIDIQIYCTPGSHQGFDWHYDVEDVFVIQVSGQKEFFLRKEANEGPEIRCHLSRGDWLYIPAGYWHKAIARTQSLHFSVGVMVKA